MTNLGTDARERGAAPQRIAVFGLGYVGTVSAACLADFGHSVIGVDKVSTKVDAINAGESPLVEAGLPELIRRNVSAGRLSATSDASTAVARSDLALICVGTPSIASGDHDLSFLKRVCEEIGDSLRSRSEYYGVVVRSTGTPGTAEEVVVPSLEAASGRQCGSGFGVASNPEFMREGTGVYDFLNPPFTVVGSTDPRLTEMLRAMYRGVDAPFFATVPTVAELLKLSCNAFHAAKIVFANEIGALSKKLGIDGREVMEIFAQDRKLNVSDKYLRPGFAFGGSCLPKDLRALMWLARQHNEELPLIDAVIRSNDLQVRRAIRMVESSGTKQVGLLGLVFKPGTDDLRESPTVELAQVLLGRGYELKIFDPYLNVARLSGANKNFIDAQIPHLTRLLVGSAEEAVSSGAVVVVSYDTPEFKTALSNVNGFRAVVDLAGLELGSIGEPYEGIAW